MATSNGTSSVWRFGSRAPPLTRVIHEEVGLTTRFNIISGNVRPYRGTYAVQITGAIHWVRRDPIV